MCVAVVAPSRREDGAAELEMAAAMAEGGGRQVGGVVGCGDLRGCGLLNAARTLRKARSCHAVIGVGPSRDSRRSCAFEE